MALLAVLAKQPAAGAPGADSATPLPPPSAFESGLRGDTDLLLLPASRRPAPRPTVVVATHVNARPEAVASVALDLAAMRQALPALVRADVVTTSPGARRDAWPDRLIAWEVEIPLFNLTGRAWLRQRDDGMDLTLVDGAFAPGYLRVRVAPAAAGGTIATCELKVDVRSASWIFRKVARHDPWAETAMTAATAWVLARAVALRAESGGGQPPARPRGAITPPDASALDGAALAAPAMASLRAMGTLAAVRRAPGGRLAWASVASTLSGAPATMVSRLATPETWRVFPGWKTMKRRPATAAESAASPGTTLIEVDDDLPFVDFDAVWSVAATPTTRATAVKGDIRGAVFGWQVWPGTTADASLAVLSMHPRLDAAGWIERKLIAAEPLLEHAFGVALTYVDAAAVVDSLNRASADQGHGDPARALGGQAR